MKFVKSILSILSIALLAASFTGCSKTDEDRCADGDFAACSRVGQKMMKDLNIKF